MRDMFYNGNAQMEQGAVVCRVARSFVRFGSFQLPVTRWGGLRLGWGWVGVTGWLVSADLVRASGMRVGWLPGAAHAGAPPRVLLLRPSRTRAAACWSSSAECCCATILLSCCCCCLLQGQG